MDVRYYTYMVMKSIAGELRDNSYEPSEEEAAAKDVARNVVFGYIKRHAEALEDHRGEGVEGDEEEKRRRRLRQNAREIARRLKVRPGTKTRRRKRLDRGLDREDPMFERVDAGGGEKATKDERERGRGNDGATEMARVAFDTVARSATRGSRSYARLPEDPSRNFAAVYTAGAMPHMVNALGVLLRRFHRRRRPPSSVERLRARPARS